MPSFEILVAFFVTTAMFAYMPGPAMIYVSAQTLARGRRAGLMASIGVHLGGYFHVIAAAFGLAALLALVPQVYFLVKLSGALYLIFLGVMMIKKRHEQIAQKEGHQKDARQAFVESIIVEVLNPKTAIFFVAFLPQFVDLSAAWPVWLQMVVLGTIVNLLFSSADLFCVLFASLMISRLRKSGTGAARAKLAGGSFLILLGGKLALDR
ncbi:LysE family translocator [Maritalea porphyrae]|jgi:threonine/homoserine/homoserine lactone efflux protein|uniref:LysE family translocator n=1 Tax=Maritalea porphyrae TaxID=880732 RepID=UPI0022AF0A21|nr:LysE family translocator [Maritalea porphyrae]MCZ4273662.1 LysE family translocator [Maritalea porphyrae]